MPHIHLLIEYSKGSPRREPVHAEIVRPGVYRLQFSPGFVLGIAAGDEFTILDSDGAFTVIKRSGNLAVQIFSREPIRPFLADMERAAAALGGTLDGTIERAAVLTIPITAGFSAVKVVMSKLCAAHPSLEWFYGNVYDPVDGTTPLDWWRDI